MTFSSLIKHVISVKQTVPRMILIVNHYVPTAVFYSISIQIIKKKNYCLDEDRKIENDSTNSLVRKSHLILVDSLQISLIK